LFNVALGFAFLISFLASPGGRLLSTLFEQDAVRAMPPYQGVLASVIANYWLPSILIYMVLKVLRAERYVRPGVIGHILFGIPNAILCLYAVLRIFTSTVQGGGATFALASLGTPFIRGSIYVLGVAVLWGAIRSVWVGSRLGPTEAQAKGPVLMTAGPIIAVLMIVPAVGFLAWLYAANAEVIGKAADARRAKAARFQQLCQTASRIDIYRRANDARSVLFPLPTNATYPLLEKLDFVELKRGWVQRDKLPYERLSKKPGEPVFVQGRVNVNRTEVGEAQAQYEISAKPIESKSDTAMSLYVEETTIRDRRTNDVLAVFTAIGERKTVVRGEELFCPEGFQYARYQAEVPSYVLGLMDEKTSKNFESRVAVIKSKISGSFKK
jgi:hypothetical protein